MKATAKLVPVTADYGDGREISIGFTISGTVGGAALGIYHYQTEGPKPYQPVNMIDIDELTGQAVRDLSSRGISLAGMSESIREAITKALSMTPTEIRTLRQALGMNQQRFGLALGYAHPQRCVSELERGRKKPGNAVILLMRMMATKRKELRDG